MAVRDALEVLHLSADASWREVREAYLTLARRYHPDGTAPDAARMVEINAAYECLERQRLTTTALPGSAPLTPVGPGRNGQPVAPRPDRRSLLWRMSAPCPEDSPVIDFGQYAGWRVAEVAAVDPGYLRWLSRHSSGVRFRASIVQALGPDPEIGWQASLVSR